MSESKTKVTKGPAKPLGAAAPTTPPPVAKPAIVPATPVKTAPVDSTPAAPVKKKPVAAPKKPAVKAPAVKPAVKAPEIKVEAPKTPAPKSEKPAPVTKATKAAAALSTLPDQSAVDKMVAEAAYYLAEKRNFATGFEEEDWLKAKEQIMSQLLAAKKPKKSTK
jgi:hypothetical protein